LAQLLLGLPATLPPPAVPSPQLLLLCGALEQGGVDGFGPYSSSQGTVFAAVALALYDQARDSAQAECTLIVSSGVVPMLTHSFAASPDSTGTDVDARLANALAGSVTAWEALGTPAQPLRLQATGHGELAVAASLVFVPALPPASPMYRLVALPLLLFACC
jgi:hypothetical protein